jgi:Ca-activated chloride channel family protein
MVSPLAIAILAGIAALALAGLAEWLHAKRVARVRRLVFGPSGRPAMWAEAAPFARATAFGLAAFGATALYLHDPLEGEGEPNPRASRQLLVVLDVSPSMNLSDAGPGNDKMMRGVWAGKVLQGILDRIDLKDTRVSMIAFYSKAIPMLEDSTDKNVLSNLMDGLPLYTAFKPGATDMQAGIDAAFAMSKGWARDSTTLVVISDGDLDKPVNLGRRPSSIADAIVVGVGDPARATPISGRASRQDQWTLKSLAAKLDGYYHEGNSKHLPSAVLDELTMIAPRVSDGLGLREAGLVALGAGCAVLGILTPLLALCGLRREAPASASTRALRGAIEGNPA